MTEGEMVGWHQQCDVHEFGQALGVGDGQGGLACCSPWGLKESDTTEQLNCTECVSKGVIAFILRLVLLFQTIQELSFQVFRLESYKQLLPFLFRK